MLALFDKNQADVVEAFNSSSIYLENLLNICGCGFLSNAWQWVRPRAQWRHWLMAVVSRSVSCFRLWLGSPG